jgi:hypothetical protein
MPTPVYVGPDGLPRRTPMVTTVEDDVNQAGQGVAAQDAASLQRMIAGAKGLAAGEGQAGPNLDILNPVDRAQAMAQYRKTIEDPKGRGQKKGLRRV